MELAPRYCRSCGSRILLKNVCHNCNNEPLKGDNYCYDCGALTPNADGCLKCGAVYKRKSPVKLISLIGIVVIISIAVAGFLLSRTSNNKASSKPETTSIQTAPVTEPPKIESTISSDTGVKHIDTATTLPTKQLDTAIAISKPVPDSTKKILTYIFTKEEMNAYKIRCSYFEKKDKSEVLFFIGGGSAYIKANGKIYELKRKRKGVDIAVFANEEYETIIAINGLSGSAQEWMASCTLTIKDLIQNISVKHKVYSTCIEL